MEDYVYLNGYVLEKYVGRDKRVVVPFRFRMIAPKAFLASEVEQVFIHDAVSEIDTSAFERCRQLREVSLGRGMRIIGRKAFAGCTSLAVLKLPERLREIRASAFAGCRSLREVTVPGSVSNVSVSAFNSCTSLERLELCEGVEKLERSAFEHCSALTEITFPSTLSKFSEGAFFGCTSLCRVHASAEIYARPFSWWMRIFPEPTVYFAALSTEENAAGILRQAKRNAERVFSHLLKRGKIDLLPRFLSLWKSVPQERLEIFKSLAAEAGETAFLNVLLDYSARVYPPERIEKIRADEEARAWGIKPLRVQDWKKLFRYRVETDGTVTLLRYLGDATVMLLPTRIGRRDVVSINPRLFSERKDIEAVAVDAENEYFVLRDGDLYTKNGGKRLFRARKKGNGSVTL